MEEQSWTMDRTNEDSSDGSDSDGGRSDSAGAIRSDTAIRTTNEDSERSDIDSDSDRMANNEPEGRKHVFDTFGNETVFFDDYSGSARSDSGSARSDTAKRNWRPRKLAKKKKPKTKWLELLDKNKIRTVDIETIKEWMQHPQINLIINFKDDSVENGRTLLNCAVYYKRWDVAKILLQEGANPNIASRSGTTALMYVASEGHTKMAELLLEKHAGITSVNRKGWTVLITASIQGHNEIVELLLDKGADPNTVDENGDTALNWACREGQTDTVRLLLDRGANTSVVNKLGDTALTLASDRGHMEIVKLLGKQTRIKMTKPLLHAYKATEAWKDLFDKDKIEQVDIETIKKHMEYPDIDIFINWKDDNIEEGRTMLLCALEYERPDIAKLLLEYGADITISDRNGTSALMYVSDLGILKLLLEKGADPNSASRNGWTTLMHASFKGLSVIVEILLDNGADLKIANQNGETALGLASVCGHNEVVELLLHKSGKENINATSKSGWTALMGASYTGHTKIVSQLLGRGAAIDIANEEGDTALGLASAAGHTEIVELLSHWKDKEEWMKLIDEDEMIEVDIETLKQWLERPKKKFDINWKDDSVEDGKTMLSCAILNERLDLANILLRYGADPNTLSTNGWTALMYACDGGHIKIVQLLLDKAANISITNQKGWNALMFASDKGHTKIVELLLNKGADLNVLNKNGSSALLLATYRGHTSTAKILLDRGADICIVNKGKDTVFTLAWKDDEEILELLLDKVADLHIVDTDAPTTALGMCVRNGQTLLHLACLYNKKASVKRILGFGVDKDRVDKNGHSALFYASEKGLVDIVELLLNHNAHGNKTDERSMMERTDRRGRSYCFYDVKDGRTPLFIAAQRGHHNVVALLLKHGADPYLCNNESQIPRDVSLVHRPIQQLFRIQDFFDQRDKADEHSAKYTTCKDNFYRSKKEKKKAPPLKDIIHDIVRYSHFANKFLELYLENREIVSWLDQDGRSVQQVACRECRQAILFLGRYDLDDKLIYESPTCKIYNALDYGGPEENLTQPRLVVAKFYENEKHYENEMNARRKDDGSPRFCSKSVIPYLGSYRADQHQDYAQACNTWKKDATGSKALPDFCLMLERGERNLMEAMNNENLSADHKDLERRDILQKLCNIFSYLHGMGYVHGDIKPHNVVRHLDQTVTWKAIDFDACTKIGDVVGLKLTTGSAPPEMLKVVQKCVASDTDSMHGSKVILRQPGKDLDDLELVLADQSFDVWSFGILMYQLVTGRSFFHCDTQGSIDDAGLEELASLTESRIHEKLRSVKDVNARVLLAKILRINPKERPTMAEVGEDYYFRPSESPQGRKAKFFGKRETQENPRASLRLSQLRRAVKDDDFVAEDMEKIERYLSSKVEFSYFKLRDEDKDWSDKLLNSEVETFHFDKLGGMGEKPTLIDGDIIYENSFLRTLVSSKGPDYFMGFLVEYFELYKIMDDAHEVCQGIKANLVSDVKSLQSIFVKLFVRGKGLNDVVRGTLFCNSIDQFKYVGLQLKEQYGHNVYIKAPKKEVGAWPIPKLLIYGNRRFEGRCMSVEIQFSTVYLHLATHASNNHLVYEAIRESTGYLGDKDQEFQGFLHSLNEQYIDTEGFLRNQAEEEGHFEIVVENADENSNGNVNETQVQENTTKSTGFISGGRICCGDLVFRFMTPTDRYQRFSESSFVVNKSLTLLSSHSYWSDESYDLDGKTIEFVVSFKGRGLAIAGIGTTKCKHGKTKPGGGGDRCSVQVGRSKFVVRKGGMEEVIREKKLPNQTRAKIRFKIKDSISISFVGSDTDGNEKEIESAQVSMLPDQRYYLYMRAPPGVHEVKFHDIGIHETG